MSGVKNQRFIVDANAWIALHEEHYPPDVFPGLWRFLSTAAAHDMVKTPRQALNETGDGKKGVSAWLRAQPLILLRETPRIVTSVTEVVARFPHLTRGIEESADPWLVAHAMSMPSSVVVTQEKLSTGAPKIPNVCLSFDVKYGTLLTMLRRLSFRCD